MMSFKLSLIFVELYCLFVITKCVENSQFDISDVISDTSSYFYTTRDLEPQLESMDEIPITEPVPVKPVYTLARDFVADLETLLHKITQTFVRISQKEEGQKTMNHIYQEVFTIASNEISAGTLKYIMKESLKVMQDPNASKVVLEFFEMVQELMEYDLVDWYFVIPFLYDINRHPVPEQILEKLTTEVEYILLSEERQNSFAAAFKLFADGLSSATSESLKTIPITTSTLEPPKNAVPVKIAVSETAAATAGSAKSETSASAVQVTQIPVKQVTQIPVKQVEQISQIPVKQVKSNQVLVEQVTQVPLKQVQKVTEIPVKQVKSNQIAEEQVIPAEVETVVQSPTTPESRASKVMRRVKSLPSYFKSTTAEQV